MKALTGPDKIKAAVFEVLAAAKKMTTEGNFVQPAIPRFDAHYDHWSMLMENFLQSKEYWGLVETSYVEPESGVAQTEAQRKGLDELKLKDLKVKNYLFQVIDRTILETILVKDTSKQIWESMKKKFEGSARVKRSHLQALRREFETLEMKAGEGVFEYFSRVLSVANKMGTYGEQMQDVTVVEKILRSLSEKFNYVVCSIEESKNIDQLSIDELQSSLIVHEQKLQRHTGEEQALKITSEDRFGARGWGRVECYKCHKLGHFQSECPSWDKEANYAELGEEEEMLLMSYVEMTGARKEDVWFVDYGCSNHMCGDKSLFCDLNEDFRQRVKLGNNTRMAVLGKCTVRLTGREHAERKNRTVMNMVRCMLFEKRIPKTLWPEAVNWTTYVLNRSPTLVVKNQTPEEAWSGSKPSVEHFRVFGCVAHVHIPDVRRTKLDAKSFTCVLLGVSEESKAYRLYEPVAKKVVISRDVVFEEDKSWNWDRSYEEHIMAGLEWDDEEDNEAVNTENDGAVSEEEEEVIEEPIGSPQAGENGRESSSFDERRARRPPGWMRDYVSGERLSEEEDTNVNLALFASADPVHFEEAMKRDNWRIAMDMEMKIRVKWVYKTKLKENGEVDKFKARLVVKGYVQQQGIDYTEVFAPVARMDTVRMIVALAAQKGWTLYQLDVKSAFLHGKLNEEVYVEQPKGYELKNNPQKVYRLKKALYGLKQAPRAWFIRIEAHFISEGFEKCYSEHTLFIKTNKGGKILIVSLYVDDLIFTGNDELMFAEFKNSMLREFDMTDLGRMRFFLGIEVLQRSDGIYICQRKYALEVLKRFRMENSNSVHNPIVPGCKLFKDENGIGVDETLFKQMVGCLMYLTATRLDLMFAVSLISRYMAKPTELHLLAAKRILRYLKGTTGLGVFYKKGWCEDLVGYADSDYAGDLEDRKSTSGYVFMLGSGAVAWSSRKQPIVTLSTTEAEFVAAAACASQAVWMKRILEKLSLEESKCTAILCDNSSTIKLSKNPVLHGRSKHIDVRFHFLRDLTRERAVELVYCGTQDQLADMMTKPLTLDAFQRSRSQLGVCQVPELN
ncbi:unnamed protein product [Camellia sinensis]